MEKIASDLTTNPRDHATNSSNPRIDPIIWCAFATEVPRNILVPSMALISRLNEYVNTHEETVSERSFR